MDLMKANGKSKAWIGWADGSISGVRVIGKYNSNDSLQHLSWWTCYDIVLNMKQK